MLISPAMPAIVKAMQTFSNVAMSFPNGHCHLGK
jgi:hypothetical protein